MSCSPGVGVMRRRLQNLSLILSLLPDGPAGQQDRCVHVGSSSAPSRVLRWSGDVSRAERLGDAWDACVGCCTDYTAVKLVHTVVSSTRRKLDKKWKNIATERR
jgi:hypothetical protein